MRVECPECRVVTAVSNDLIMKLESDSNQEILDAILKDQPIFEEIELDGIKDLFELSKLYIHGISEFIVYGKEQEFIT